jgi:hypothetical protein
MTREKAHKLLMLPQMAYAKISTTHYLGSPGINGQFRHRRPAFGQEWPPHFAAKSI